MELWKWTEGRVKKSAYFKFPLYYFRIWKWGFDAYVLKYRADTYLPMHRDTVIDGKHWRLNVGWGDNQFFICDGCVDIGWKWGKFSLYLFRPDKYLHALTSYGKTVKLSFGFVKFY